MTQQIDEYTANDTYIYESPDGGKTVHKRLIGNTAIISSSDQGVLPGTLTKREAIKAKWRREHEELKERQMWFRIHKMAKENEGLQEILNQAIILYKLLKEEE